MASLYRYYDGSTITQGVQGRAVCDAALIMAREYALSRRTRVVVEEDDGYMYTVGPHGEVRPLSLAERRMFAE